MRTAFSRTWGRWVVFVVAAALLLAACGGSGAGHMSGPGRMDRGMGGHMGGQGEGQPGGSGPVEVPADAQRVRVIGTEFAFDPAEFSVEAGRPVAVSFANEGSLEHDWVLYAADGGEVDGAHADASPGEEAMAVFTLEPGTYQAICTLRGHEEAGMTGEVRAE